MSKLPEKANFLWPIANRLRGSYKTVRNPKAMLPLTKMYRYHDVNKGSHGRAVALCGTGMLALLFVSLLALYWPANITHAADPELTIEVVPTSVALPLEGEASVEVVVRNPTTYTLKNLALYSFTNSGVSVVISGDNTLTQLIPNEKHIWTLKLSKKQEDPTAGPVYIRADFTLENPSPNPPTERSVFASLDVTDRASVTTDKIADVKVETTITSINERRPGKLYLVITNKSNSKIYITGIEPRPTRYIRFTPTSMGTIVELVPRQAHTAMFDIETLESVQSGKYLLLFEVALKWGEGKADQRASLIATQQVDVGVFGESEVLAPLAVPSFFVLPGFLMVALWGLLWPIFKPKDTFRFKILSTEFWLIAITLSLLMAFWLYPFLTGRFSVVPRNYLDSYGFSDIALVWGWSLGLSFVSYFVVIGGFRLYRLWDEARKARDAQAREFAVGDEPLVILRKLAKRGQNLYLPQLQVIEGQPRNAFLLERYDRAQPEHWVAPPMSITGTSAVSPAINQQIQAQMGERGNAAILAKIIQENIGLGVVWMPQGSIIGPRKLNTNQFDAPPQSNIIVQ